MILEFVAAKAASIAVPMTVVLLMIIFSQYIRINEADAIVFGSPIYYYQITGKARIWLDRTFPMLGDNFTPRHPGKKLITIFVQGSPDPKIGAESVKFANDILE